jgi:hypothetical protein
MQNVSQSFDARADPMRCRTVLTGRDSGMLSAHLAAALPALSDLHKIPPDFRSGLFRNVRRRNDIPLRLAQLAAAIWAARLVDRNSCGCAGCYRVRRRTEPEITLTWFPAGRLWILFRFAFGERSCTTSAFQLLDLGL